MLFGKKHSDRAVYGKGNGKQSGVSQFGAHGGLVFNDERRNDYSALPRDCASQSYALSGEHSLFTLPGNT
jgi:hypothetical protein